MKRKVLSLFLVVAMVLSLGITVSAAEPADDLSGAVVILHTNDVHGAIDGYAKAAALKKTYEDMGAYVLPMPEGLSMMSQPSMGRPLGFLW